MENENKGENLDKNQETEGQQIKRLREERNTYKAQKSHWKKKAEAKPKEPAKADKKETKSDEPDYAKLAFLEGKKVVHTDDQKLVMDEAKRLQLPLTDILNMKHIKTQLKDATDQREAEDGTPKGKGKTGGKTQNDVDYWVAKGKAPEDPELRKKYFEVREKKESMQDEFSDDLYTHGAQTVSKE